MRALQLYDPVFQYLCHVNRHARNQAPFSYQQVRQELENRLRLVDQQANDDPGLREQVRLLKGPVNYFIDHMIAQSRLPFARKWLKEAFGYREDGLAGDDAFFLCLNDELRKQPSADLAERLLVYYVCLGLGFQGGFFNDPGKLQEYMRSLKPAVNRWLLDDSAERLVPQAYEHTNRRNFIRPPKLNRALLLAGLVALLCAGVPLYAWLANDLVTKIAQKDNLREINESRQGTPYGAANQAEK